jgi:hypothetical protein
MARTWTYVVIGVATFGVLTLAGIEMTSHAREKAVGLQSFRSEQPVAFETSPIVGSDASISTYGPDQARTTDW